MTVPDARPGRRLLTDVLAPLDRLRLLTEDDDDARELVLSQLDARGPRERTMITELAARQPLADPAAFPDAHRLVVRAMEVYARNAHRSPTFRRLGPLRPLEPVWSWLVELMARYISFSYLATISDSLRDLYARREAQCLPGSPERLAVRRARIDVDRMEKGFKSSPLGIPAFLIGALLIPAVATLARAAGGVLGLETPWLVTTAVVAFLVTALLSWVMLRGAAMAHRRAVVALRRPLEALWATVGNAGRPPRDDSLTFAYVSIVITVLGWIAIPVAVSLIIALG